MRFVRTVIQAMKWLAPSSRAGRRAWTFVCLFLFIGLQFFAVSSALHKSLHTDAQQPSHTCAITLLSHDGIEPAASHVPLPDMPQVAAVIFASELPPLTAALRLLPPGRAPPVV